MKAWIQFVFVSASILMVIGYMVLALGLLALMVLFLKEVL